MILRQKISTLILLLSLSLRVFNTSAERYTVESYPSYATCHASLSNEENDLILCDPDSVIDDPQSSIQNFLANIKLPQVCQDQKLQIGIALANQIKLPLDEDLILEKTQEFAMNLHNKWGIGTRTECGDAGLFILISMQDRVCYISKGSAFNEILSNDRLDYAIYLMTKNLQENKVTEALSSALYYLLPLMERGTKPTFSERFQFFLWNNAGLLFFIAFIGAFTFGAEYLKARERREYARVRSQLSELDRQHALALQGQYENSTSCPICFEDFAKTEAENTSEQETNLLTRQQEELIGSDGQLVQILRCGHAFCESCYQTWIQTGQGDVSVCPVCKQDIGTTSTTSTIPASDSSTLTQRQPQQNSNYNIYRQERLFRLARLAHRYPRYIHSNQVQRWGNEDYRGTMVKDTEFVRNEPTRATSPSQRNSSSAGNGSHVSFGGGSSSGGRGGRW